VKHWLMAILAMATLTGCALEEAPPVDGEPKSEMIDGAGTTCMTHGECDGGMLCHFTPGTCGGAIGTCQAAMVSSDAPAQHVAETGPVCGCDGRDFANSDGAWLEGVSVWYEGSCDQPAPAPMDDPEQPGPTGSGPACPAGCGAGEFCFSTDGSCSLDGGVGECRKSSAACTSSAKTVCGCDGETYGSECGAISNGASIAHMGPC
jgi:hypothetical protein